MLRKHVPNPFRLHCITDRAIPECPEVSIVDGSSWKEVRREGMRPTTSKLRLFKRSALPFEEFLYMDLSLVVHNSMGPLLSHAEGSNKDLVVVKDWWYDCHNTCVMRIRQTPQLEGIYTSFMEGKIYPYQVAGDQDFLTACAADLGLDPRIEHFDATQVVSYKALRTLNRTDPVKANRLIRGSTVVKFHGNPKMHEIIDPFFNFTQIRLGKVLHGHRDARFWVPDIKKNWC